jgi:penicillin G amidase
MRTLGRWVSRLVQLVVFLLVLVLVAVVVMGAITTQRGWSETTGTLTLGTLHRPVTVQRDRFGIIQITAEDRHDLFVAQGYTHAQERMWQMEISRRIGAGRLSELFGKGQVDTDTYIRTLGWRVSAERDVAAMSADSLAIMQAYSDGVNAWIGEHNGQLSTSFVVAGLLSGSGGIGGITLEPWTPLDTATWQKVQAWSLGGNLDAEIFRLLADARLGSPAMTDELFPSYGADRPVITPTGLVGSGGAGSPGAPPTSGQPSAALPQGDGGAASVALRAQDTVALDSLGRMGSTVAALAGLDRGSGLVGDHGIGSNNWVVSGDRTISGKPILANDPHLGFGMPSVWIINGLHCRTVDEECPWDVVGVSFPGAPAVVLGHNARIAWGATNVGPDTQDLFLEKPDPSDPQGHYIYQGKSVAYDVRHETIKVGGGDDVQVDVRSTRHGVVLSDVDARLAGGPILALRWVTTAEVDLALQSFLKIDIAANFDEFKAAFDDYGSPSQNFIYADVDGHIGYVLPGLIPVRAGPATGERVRVGTSGAEEWTGYIPRTDLPWQFDPEPGQIVSANNAAVDGFFPQWLGRDWDPGYRAARIIDLLAAVPGKIRPDDMRAIQMDTYVGRADKVMSLLETIGPDTKTEDGQLLWQSMVDWNRECDTASTGCAAYISVELALQRAIFDDELGPLAREYIGSTYSWSVGRLDRGGMTRPSPPRVG